MYDGIIFDVDGTLWNACGASAKGINKSLRELGIKKEFRKADIESIAGDPFLQGFQSLLPDLKIDGHILAILNNGEEEIVKKEGGEFYDGVPEEIESLAATNKVYLVSNCQDWYLEVFMDLSGLRSCLTGYDCNGMSNLPKGEMLKRLKEKHKLTNPVYVGDTAGDKKASEEANIDFIHAAYGFGNFEDEDVVGFQSLKEIIEYLKSENTSHNSA